MEFLTDRGCESWHELIAMRALGDLPLNEQVGLLAHLEGCASCQRIDLELRETVNAMSFADARVLIPTASLPAGLVEEVLRDLQHANVHHRRIRRNTMGLVSLAAVAVALIVGLVSVFTGGTTSSKLNQRTFALHGSGSVSARAVLTGRSWGTAVSLHEKGLPGGQVYTVSMSTASGNWWVAGSYHTVSGRSVDATMTCAVALHQITGIRVVDNAGTTVLSTYPPGTP